MVDKSYYTRFGLVGLNAPNLVASLSKRHELGSRF